MIEGGNDLLIHLMLVAGEYQLVIFLANRQCCLATKPALYYKELLKELYLNSFPKLSLIKQVGGCVSCF